MKPNFKIVSLLLIFTTFSYSQNVGFASGEIRYNMDRIKSTEPTSFVLTDGTIWDIGHFLTYMPNEEVIVAFTETTSMAIAYINGVERNVTFAGTTYDASTSTMDIIRYRTGTFSYINYNDTTNHLIQLLDSTYWYVHPDKREEVKTWNDGDRVILDDSKNLITNLRLYEFAPVVQAEVKFTEP